MRAFAVVSLPWRATIMDDGIGVQLRRRLSSSGRRQSGTAAPQANRIEERDPTELLSSLASELAANSARAANHLG